MLYASVVRAPVWGAKVRRVDATAARASTGVRQVVELDDRVAVVADSHWHALKGRERLVIEWDDGPLATLDDAAIGARLRAIADEGPGGVARDNGDVDAVDAGSASEITLENVSKDDWLFAVEAYDASGATSLPVYPQPVR